MDLQCPSAMNICKLLELTWLYSYGRIAHQPLAYWMTTFNCDVVTNYLQWTTRTPESCMAFVIEFLRTPREGVITIETLEQIEAENPLLSD